MADQPLLSAAAPVFSVDDEAKGELARDLLRLEVEEGTDGLKTCSAHFLATGGSADPATGTFNYLDGSVVDFGKRLKVSIGPSGSERVIFEGIVSALGLEFSEGDSPDVHIQAEDTLMKLRMTRRSRTYKDSSDADIVQAIASEHGLQGQADVDGPTHKVVQQLDQTDLAFLRDRAHDLGAELWVADTTLHMAQRPKREATSVTLVQGNELIAAQVRADLAHQRTAVHVTGYDAAQRDKIDEQAGNDVVQAEVTDGRTGAQVLEDALGERVVQLARTAPLTGAEASALARAEMLRRARSFVSVSGLTSGTPDLVVGSRLRLERVGPTFEGDGYYVTRVRHTYDLRSGHRTQFEAERPTIGAGTAT